MAIDLPVMMAIASAFLYGVVMIAMRRLGSTDKSAATVFYFTAGSAIIAGAVLPLEWVTPPVGDLMLLVTIGVLGGVGQIFMTQAFRLAPPAIVAPFDYTAMVWALLIGWFVFGNFPAANSLVGAGVICLSGLFILYRETALGTRKTPLKRTSI
jgi:drug/metabolite transporter (DMT)-like permease